jgi:hypothetical protein
MSQKDGTLCYNVAEASNLKFFCRYQNTLSPRIDIAKYRGGGSLFREFPPKLLQSERFFVNKLRELHQLLNCQINSFGNFFPRKSAQKF